MINNKDNRWLNDDPDELWDDDLDIVSGSNISNADVEEDKDKEEVAVEAGLASDRMSGTEYSETAAEEVDDDFYSDKVETYEADEAENKKSRKSFFKLRGDEEVNDFFDNETEPEPKLQPKPKQVLDPEDPDYWVEDEPDYAHIIPRPKKVWKWWLAGIIALTVALIGVWVWFFRPYIDGAIKYGYIDDMKREGTFIKTFEGVLIPYKEVGDTAHLQLQKIRFSVAGDSLAAHMKGMMLKNVPVRLEYEVYHSPILWKGNETMIITKADTADENKILPPEFR